MSLLKMMEKAEEVCGTDTVIRTKMKDLKSHVQPEFNMIIIQWLSFAVKLNIHQSRTLELHPFYENKKKM